MTLPRPIHGIIPPVLTPLLDRDTLDVPAFERLLEYLIAGRASALFILGSTGEAPGLTDRLRREVMDRAHAVVGNRVPILVGITDPSFVDSLDTAEYAARAGASGLVLSPPFYYLLSQASFLGYLERLTPLLPLPLYLYNMPNFTKLVIAPETVRAAASLPNVYGLKDSSGDKDYFRACRDAVAGFPDFALLVGVEEILAEMVPEGAHGGVCGGSNLYPALYADLYDAAACGDKATVQRLQKVVLAISEGIYTVGDRTSSYLRGLKTAVSLIGYGNGVMAEPYSSLTVEEREQIRLAIPERPAPVY
ncbi:MAG: dihydrodipicolinate synthase family protein [Bryobacteraceae bacterium]